MPFPLCYLPVAAYWVFLFFLFGLIDLDSRNIARDSFCKPGPTNLQRHPQNRMQIYFVLTFIYHAAVSNANFDGCWRLWKTYIRNIFGWNGQTGYKQASLCLSLLSLSHSSTPRHTAPSLPKILTPTHQTLHHFEEKSIHSGVNLISSLIWNKVSSCSACLNTLSHILYILQGFQSAHLQRPSIFCSLFPLYREHGCNDLSNSPCIVFGETVPHPIITQRLNRQRLHHGNQPNTAFKSDTCSSF